MTALFHAHSGLRLLILLLGALNIAVLGYGLVLKGTYGKGQRILGSSYTGLLHLQVLIGIGLVAMGRYYPALIGHMVMMSVATVVSQLTQTLNRKKPTPGFALPLAGVIGSLVCIFGGVMAIGRGLFTMSPS